MLSERSGHRRHRKAMSECRAGSHRFGSPRRIGGGITRQICQVCGEVSIDITGSDPAPVLSSVTKRNTRGS